MQWSMLLIFTDKVSTGNVEMNSTMAKLRNHRDSSGRRQGLDGNALQVRSLQVNENRSRFGHVSTVIGKCSLEDPVSDEDSMGAEQFEGSRKFNNNVGRAS